MNHPIDFTEAHLLGDTDWIGIDRLCRIAGLELAAIVELAELGWLTPRGYVPAEWQLPATLLPRLSTMARLMRDLGVNVSGAVLALELLEEQRQLRRRVRELEGFFSEEY